MGSLSIISECRKLAVMKVLNNIRVILIKDNYKWGKKY